MKIIIAILLCLSFSQAQTIFDYQTIAKDKLEQESSTVEDAKNQIEYLINLNEFVDARNRSFKLLEDNFEDVELHFLYLRSLEGLQNTEEIYYHLNVMRTSFPDDYSTNLAFAWASYLATDYGSSLEALNAIEVSDNDFNLAYYTMALSLLQLDRPADARDLLINAMAERSKADLELQALAAYAAYLAGDDSAVIPLVKPIKSKSALAAYTYVLVRGLEHFDSPLTISEGIALAKPHERELKAALLSLQAELFNQPHLLAEAKLSYPFNPFVHANLGLVFLDSDIKVAQSHLATAYDLEKNQDIALIYSYASQLNGDYDLSIRLLDDIDSLDAKLLLADSFYLSGNFVEALKILESLTLEGDDEFSRLEKLSAIYLAREDFSKASGSFKALYDLSKDDSFLILSAQAILNADNDDNLGSIVEELNNPYKYYLLGLSELRKENREDAQELWDLAMADGLVIAEYAYYFDDEGAKRQK